VPIPNLPTRASVYGTGPRPAEPPPSSPRFRLTNGLPEHQPAGKLGFVAHDLVRKPADFHQAMHDLGTPEAHAMRVAAQSGYKWSVGTESFKDFAGYDSHHLASLVNAKPGDHVEFRTTNTGMHEVRSFTPLNRPEGNKMLKAWIDPNAKALHVTDFHGPDKKTPGWGMKAMLQMVQTARKMGIDHLHMEHAAGDALKEGKAYNGYYTWPRLGWDGELDGHNKTRLPDHLQGVNTFHELMADPVNREHWRLNGNDAMNLYFDARRGSEHTRRLASYVKNFLQARRLQKSRLGQPSQLARADSHSWLSPGGEFHPVTGGSHSADAQKRGKSIEGMWKDGWHRVTHVGKMLIAHNEHRGLNGKQKQALIDHAIEEKHTHVMHDNGEDEKVIWSEEDKV
jgi:hypothetical protein